MGWPSAILGKDIFEIDFWIYVVELCRLDEDVDRAAAIYTLVQTIKLNYVNPKGYLRDILAKIADGHPIKKIDALLPWQEKSSG